MDITDNSAIITGSTGKLGSEIALALARAGCDCICHYHTNTDKAEQLKLKIEKLGKKAVLVKADLSDIEQIKNIFAADLADSANILINSAAVFTDTPIDQTDQNTIDHIFRVNATAPLLISARFAHNIRQRKTVGKIINIADIAGQMHWKRYSAYSSSKAALISQTISLAKELAPDITVNAIAPGIVQGVDKFTEQRQVDKVPLKRAATIAEITSSLLHLLENDYITGQTINIDGGRSV